MLLKQSRFVHSACGPFTKNKKKIKEFKETWDSRYIYQNKLDKACFQNDMAYGTAADKILRYKAFNAAKNPK